MESVLLVHMVHISVLKAFHRDVIHLEMIFDVALSGSSYNENVTLESMGFLGSK